VRSADGGGATTRRVVLAAADLLLEQSAPGPGADHCDVLRVELHPGPCAQPDKLR